MITKLGVLDFQSIKQLAVECGPITVFVGESDSGKSALVRALYAAAFNDYPSDHVRAGQGFSTVVVATEEGSIQVEKGQAKNRYALQPRGGAARQEWNRVGREVPEEVAAFLGWRVVELDDGTKFAPSIQRQFDGPFLLADSPTRVAKVLGSLTNISTLFAAIREGTLEERRAKQRSDAALEEAKRHAEDREAVAAEREEAAQRAQAARAAFDAAEVAVERFGVVEALWRSLKGAQALVGAAQSDVENARSARVEVPDLDAQFEDLAQIQAVLEKVWQATSRLKAAEEDLRLAREAQADADVALEAYVSAMEICPLCERPM